MLHKNGEAAADQHRQEKKIEEVSITDPQRKAVGRRNREVQPRHWDLRQAEDGSFSPSQKKGQEHHRRRSRRKRRLDPDPKPPIGWVMNRSMCRVEMNHAHYLRFQSMSTSTSTSCGSSSKVKVLARQQINGVQTSCHQ